MNIPQPIKSRLAQLATFPEKYTLQELNAEVEMVSAMIKRWQTLETELTQSALKIE
jgi:hypothetical protein